MLAANANQDMLGRQEDNGQRRDDYGLERPALGLNVTCTDVVRMLVTLRRQRPNASQVSSATAPCASRAR